MQSPTFPSLRHRPRDSSACQAVSTCQAHKSLIHKRYTRGSQLRAKQARVEQTPPSSAGSGEPANGNSMSAAELRSSQSISSRALGSEDVLDVLLQSAELLLIMGLAGAQGTMLLRVWQQQQQQVEQEHSTDTQKHQEISMAVEPLWLPRAPDSALWAGTSIALPLILMLNWLLRKRMSLRQARVAAAAGLSAGARIMRLELLATRQSQALLAAERQLTKLNTRARLLGQDLQPPLRQVQAENIQQAETLVKLTERLEGLNSDVQDTQQLIGALHSATAKQLQLVMQALTISQAAKALALSASSAAATGSGAAASNGAVPSEVTKPAPKEHKSLQSPKAVSAGQQQQSLQSDDPKIDIPPSAPTASSSQQHSQSPSAAAESAIRAKSIGLQSVNGSAVEEFHAHSSCSTQNTPCHNPSEVLYGVANSGLDRASPAWSSAEINRQQSMGEAAGTASNQSRQWWPVMAEASAELQTSDPRPPEEDCTRSHAGEMIGEYVMYRF